MKRIIFIFLISTILLTSKIFAQDTLSKKNIVIIKTDIAMPVIGLATNFKAGSLTLELGLKHRHSIQLTGLITSMVSTEFQHKTIQIIPAYKYFLSKKRACTGIYSGLYLKGSQYTSINDHRHFSENYYLEYKQNTLGGGLLLGYQNYIMKRMVVDFLVGFGARQAVNTTIIKSENISLGDIKNTYADGIIAMNIGYKFWTGYNTPLPQTNLLS